MDDRCETEWRTSSYTGEQGQCVEVRVSRNVCMRDTKARSAGMLQVSAEAWAGLVGRLSEFEIGPINITPSITGGLSVVTDTIGSETTRTAASGESAAILYYLAPEIAVSHDDHPEWEAFGRIQHRSGGFGTIAHIDGSNALTLGLRYKF